MNDDYRSVGFAMLSGMLGEGAAKNLKANAESGAYLSAASSLALDFAFGGVWARGGLEMKHRSLIVIAILVATHSYTELRNHIRIGVRNGLTNEEIEEALIQCIPYVGFPAVSSALGPVVETLREIGRDPGGQTPQERGVL